MKEIIYHGKYSIQKYIIKCYKCGCKFTYSENEIHGYDCLHNPLYVSCPECNKWNRHEYSQRIK